LSILQNSWSSFSRRVASDYLTSFGESSVESKKIICDVLKELYPNKSVSLIDLGCGNGNLAEYLKNNNVLFKYTGVDFSDILLEAAKEGFPNAEFIKDDVNSLKNISTKYDVAIYSHVLEVLSSPEESLLAARKFADTIIIRFYEPPENDVDWVEILELNTGEETSAPYLRRKISKDYYRLILSKMGCKSVDVYSDGYKDQVHVLHY
jgi:SAM-dependent methyltransferase